MVDFDMYIDNVRKIYGQECVDNILNSDFSGHFSYGAKSDEEDDLLEKAASGVWNYMKSAAKKAPEYARRQQENKRREFERDMRSMERLENEIMMDDSF